MSMTHKRNVASHWKLQQESKVQKRLPGAPSIQYNAMKRLFDVGVLYSLVLALFLCGVTNADTTDFRASLSLYGDASYSSKLSNPNLKTDERIYLQVDTDLASEVKLVLQQCWGTPSPAPRDPESLVVIKNPGCPTDVLPTRVSVNGERPFARFDFQVFKFRSSDAITVHCIVQLCINDCVPKCSSRRKRQADVDGPDINIEMISTTFQVVSDPVSPHELLPPHNVSIQTEAPGPTEITTTAENEIDKKSESPFTEELIIVIGVLAGILLLIGVLAVTLVRCKLKRRKKKREKIEKSVDVYSIIKPSYNNA